MKSLPVIKKMDPDSEGEINVCLIQCALFCKGYYAGGITGIYYTSGVSAVRQMQEDAGIPVTGIIDWKVWAGLLSLNWFNLVQGGDGQIRIIQKQLNSDWSDIIGVGPCDGIMSRQTALSLIGALQAAENVTTDLIPDLNELNFGIQTESNFPDALRLNQNSSYFIPFNKILQYALYFNGFDPGRVDGVFDYNTEQRVIDFQTFYALVDIGLVTPGEVNVSTMKSLLVSKGDTKRIARACDCSTVLNKQQAADLKHAGYTHVGRYLTGSVGDNFIPKYITKDEAKYIEEAGLSVFPIYQDGGWSLKYFYNRTQGADDSYKAIKAAEDIGVPDNTTIYFAVDFDCLGNQVEEFVIPYFRSINAYFKSERNKKHYRVGIYAPRYVCTLVSDSGLAASSFVADMSTGFSGNLGFPLPANWAFDQFYEYSFPSAPNFPLDKVAYSGRDSGFSVFDAVPDNPIDYEKEQLDQARHKIVCDICSQLGYLDKILQLGFTLEQKVYLDIFDTANAILSFAVTVSENVVKKADADFDIDIEVNNDGVLSGTFQAKLDEMTSVNALIDYDILSILSNISLDMGEGYITFSITEYSNVHIKLLVAFNIPVIESDGVPLEAGISVCFEFSFTSKNPNDYLLQEEYIKSYLLGVTLGIATLAGIGLISSGAFSGIGAAIIEIVMQVLARLSIGAFVK